MTTSSTRSTARTSLLAVLFAAACAALAPGAAPASPNAYVVQGETGDPGDQHALATVDVATGAVVNAITLNTLDPNQIAIDPVGEKAYVSFDEDAGGIRRVNLATGTQGPLFGPPRVGGVAVAPDSKRLYATADAADELVVIDTATNAVVDTVDVGDRPGALAVNAAGTRAYVANSGAPYSVSVVDLTTNTVVTTIFSVDFDRPEHIAISPGGLRVWVSNFGGSADGNSVTAINTATNTVAGSTTVGEAPTGLTMNLTGTRLYVLNRDSDSVSVVNNATRAVTTTIPLTFHPSELAITPDGRRAVVSSRDDDKVAIVDLASNTVVGTPATLVKALGVAIPPAQSPIAAVAATPAPAGEPTSFDGSASKVPGGAVTRYDWDFGDGTTALNAGPQVAHAYAAEGSYEAKLTVSNECDITAVFGPLGVAFGGTTARCNGPRTNTATQTVTIPAGAGGAAAGGGGAGGGAGGGGGQDSASSAEAIVVTSRAKVSAKGIARVRVACVAQLACSGAITLRTVKAAKKGTKKSGKAAKLGSKRFSGLAAGAQRTISVRLSRKALRTLRARRRLSVTATASVLNPGAASLSRARKIRLSAAR